MPETSPTLAPSVRPPAARGVAAEPGSLRARVVVAGLVATKLLLHLATVGLYPFHRDEIYLLLCGRHLAWGSPDHAPLAPALAHLASSLLSDSPTALRVVGALAGAATVAWTARLTRRLGGDGGAQVVAAALVLVAPLLLYYGGVYCTGSLEVLCWIAACDCTVAALGSRSLGRWVAVGVALGVGLLTKHTSALCGVGLALGLYLCSERPRRRAGPWVAAATALMVALPNLLWQARHGAPALAFAVSSHESIAQRFGRFDVPAAQTMLLGPVTFAVALLGLKLALSARGVERMFAALFFVVAAVVIAVPGKPYYATPACLPLVAIGARPVAAWLAHRAAAVRAALACAWLASGALAFALTVPVLPVATLVRLGVERINSEVAQFADWRAVASDVARAHRDAGGSPSLRVLTDSYGTAAALELHGPALGLAVPASGANGYYAIGPGDEPESLLIVGYPPALLDELCASRTRAGVVRSPNGLDNRYDFPRTIWLCPSLRTPLSTMWPRLRRFD